MVKNLLRLILILFAITSAYSYDYNESYTDLYLETNGWCSGFEVNFKVYNLTEYEENKNVDDYSFQNISEPEVKIYSGPLSSLPLYLEEKASSTGEFSYTFDEPNQYLVEVYPTGKFNDYHELIYIDECKNADVEKVNSYSALKDRELLYTDVKIILNDTNITSEEEITVQNIDDLSAQGIANLENVQKTVWLKGENENFSKMSLEISLPQITQDDVVEAFIYKSSNWEKVDAEINSNKVLIENITYGIYAVSFEQDEPEVTSEVQDTEEITETGNSTQTSTSSEDDALNTQSETQDDIAPPMALGENSSSSSSSSSGNLLILIGGIILIIVIVVFGLSMAKKKKAVKEEQKAPEVLNSYTAIYDHVKKYVEQYKDKFGKDQIYRALLDANTPKDIIDKVFLEVYK